MGDYHYIACDSCKVFAGTYKWDGSPPDYLHSIYNSTKSKCVSNHNIKDSVSFWKNIWCKRNAEHWFNDLSQRIIGFSENHEGHKLIIYTETDAPWYPEHAGYLSWKELDLGSSGELYLPRNIIDDLGIMDWDQVEEYLKNLTVFTYDDFDLDEYKKSYFSLLNAR